uniref:Uncharacterized protein LOC111129651 n=1 Tax=Crassostrea virginica TaxID=6565 RepID=A0A8B8DWD3_CRAVI|nr:uncharacterized protein LOC111129651 [Crassostrea virginica]
MEKGGFEKRLRTAMSEYLSTTNTRTMTPVRKQILQILIFLYGKENRSQSGVFSHSKNREIADQQKKYILFSYLFLEALRKNTITETDLTTLQRMWDKHLLSLVDRDMEKTAERYETILHSSEETIINIKRFQRHLVKSMAAVTEEMPKTMSIPFSFRKSSFKEKLILRLKNFFGQGDPKDFLMIKFYEVK